MRRFLSALLIIGLVAAAAYTLWTWKRPGSVPPDPWNAIPAQSAIVIEVPEALSTWDRSVHTTQLWDAFATVPGIAGAGRLLQQVAERMENDAALRSALGSRTVLIALMRSGGERLGSLFVGTRDGVAGTLADQALADVFGADAQAMAALASGSVVQVRPDTALPALSLCLTQGFWLVASSPGVMDEALLQLKSGTSLADDPVLSIARNTLGAGADAHLLVHSTRARDLLGLWWRPDALEHLDLPRGWAALDLRVRPDALLLSGLLAPEDDDPMLKAMQLQGVGRSAALRVLPATVSTARIWNISAPAEWSSLRGKSEDPHYEALLGWVQGGIGTAMAPGNEPSLDMAWGFFETSDPEMARAQLDGLCGSGCDSLSHREIRISRLPFTGAHERLLGATYEFLEQPWWTVLGDVVLFSNEPSALMASIDAWSDGGTLSEDARTSEWFTRISAEAGFTAWCDVARTWPSMRKGLRESTSEGPELLGPLSQSLGGLSLQVSPGQRGFHHLMVGLHHAPLAEQPKGTAWSTAIGAAVDRAPDIVRNHVNNTHEVLVQDVQHRLHLLAGSGKLLWTRQLDGPILGTITQVDRFRNGKLQLLLNTTGTIHLMDRNGQDVGGFPVDLRSPASAPLAVFDYDKERDYRVIIPTSDGHLRNYGLDGQATKGWENPRLGAPAASQVVHLRIKGKDYLVAVGGDGAVHVFDRRGVVRDRTTLNVGAKPEVIAITPGPELFSSRIVWRDEQGRLWTSDLKGSAPPEVHLQGYYTSNDSLIYLDGGVPRTLRTFGTPLLRDVDVHALDGGGHVIVVTHTEEGRISLLDKDGRDLQGSPLPGAWNSAPVDMDLDGHIEVVTVTRDGSVIAHRLSALRDTQQ